MVVVVVRVVVGLVGDHMKQGSGDQRGEGWNDAGVMCMGEGLTRGDASERGETGGYENGDGGTAPPRRLDDQPGRGCGGYAMEHHGPTERMVVGSAHGRPIQQGVPDESGGDQAQGERVGVFGVADALYGRGNADAQREGEDHPPSALGNGLGEHLCQHHKDQGQEE